MTAPLHGDGAHAKSCYKLSEIILNDFDLLEIKGHNCTVVTSSLKSFLKDFVLLESKV